MARIRTIKPEFFQDEKLSPLPPLDRLLFLGLISMADDCGRLLDNVKVIDAFVFPETAETSREALANLSRIGRIERGTTASGQRVIQIVNWTKHQRVDKPNNASALPEIVAPSEDTTIRESVANDSGTIREPLALRPTTNDHLPTTNDQLKPPAAKAAVSTLESEFEEAWRAYPRKQGDARTRARRAYLARRKAGVTAEELLAGVQAYAAHLARERTDPKFFKSAATFFGPDEFWREDWGPPAARKSPGEDVFERAIRISESAA